MNSNFLTPKVALSSEIVTLAARADLDLDGSSMHI